MRELKVGEFFLDDEGKTLCQVVNSNQIDLRAAAAKGSDFVIEEGTIVFFCNLESGELCCDNRVSKLVEVPIDVNLAYKIVKH